MPPPKSQKLLREEVSKTLPSVLPEPDTIPVLAAGEPLKIKEVVCCNDFVAILQFRIQSNLELGDTGYKQEGMVVGFGPGLPTASGNRCPSQLSMGDVVTFFGNPTLTLEPKNGLYAGRKIIVIPERSIICHLPKVPFEVVKEDKQPESP